MVANPIRRVAHFTKFLEENRQVHQSYALDDQTAKKIIQVVSNQNPVYRLLLGGRTDEVGYMIDAYQKLAHLIDDYSQNLETEVQQRTQELASKNEDLEQTLLELKKAQTHLVQAEKMSSLGQMVAGIAHEINNPITFISGNMSYVHSYFQSLIELIEVYQQYTSTDNIEIQQKINEIELDFLKTDIEDIMISVKTGSDRIRDIVSGLRNFSRLDESHCKSVDLHEGLENTLLLLQHRFKHPNNQAEILIERSYSILPLVNCYASQINQVFFQILTNALDAVSIPNKESDSIIRISTEVESSNTILISIEDNGVGISPDVQAHIFDPFFTTKSVGKGTGLGLAIAHQIITEEHGGKITCTSELDQGTVFKITLPI